MPLEMDPRQMSDDARLRIPALRYLALGDSYTVGEGVAPGDAWPVQLVHALREAGIAMADPDIIAQTGWSTDELLEAIETASPDLRYNLVSLQIGVNNQYRGRGLEEYREQFGQLLQRAIDCAGGRRERVLVLSIPDWGVTPFARAEEGRTPEDIGHAVDAFNVVAFEVCAGRGVAFLDITPTSREDGAEARMLVDDGLHPSGEMYARWSRHALKVVRAMEVPR